MLSQTFTGVDDNNFLNPGKKGIVMCFREGRENAGRMQKKTGTNKVQSLSK